MLSFMFPPVSRLKKGSSLFSLSLLISSTGKKGVVAADTVGLFTETKATLLLESNLRFKGFELGNELVCGSKPCSGRRFSIEDPATSEPLLTCKLSSTRFPSSLSREGFTSRDLSSLTRVGPSSELWSMSVFLEPSSSSTQKTNVTELGKRNSSTRIQSNSKKPEVKAAANKLWELERLICSMLACLATKYIKLAPKIQLTSLEEIFHPVKVSKLQEINRFSITTGPCCFKNKYWLPKRLKWNPTQHHGLQKQLFIASRKVSSSLNSRGQSWIFSYKLKHNVAHYCFCRVYV